ncbi:putative oxidoreductase [Escherichia coli]|uniref:Putative oxidoreductase n=1 Tax=Escherichia coli TaxID=562 RepID=A0A376X093_ECOLX|nr:putative oxidoreductase [Escherichia coli]
MKKLRIGVVGLGGIAQKAWLPVLAAASDWTLQGAWSPTRAKALPICESWRIPYAIRYPALPPVAMRFLCIPAPPATLTWSVRYSMRGTCLCR